MEKEKLEFKILEPNVDGKNSLLNDTGTLIATLQGENGVVDVAVAGETKIYWDGEDYKTPESFPDDLIKYLKDPEENKVLGEAHAYYESLGNWFNCSVYDGDGELVCDDTIDLKCNSNGTADFNDLKKQMVDYYKDIFTIEEEITISPKEYIEQGGMTTSDKEDLVKDDKEKD